MPRAWFMDDSDCDQRLPHLLEYLSFEQLADVGVLYWKIDPVNYEQEGILGQIRSDRGYSYSDIITVCPEKLPNYEHKIKSFFEEHLHNDEEIRFILEGSGYFDVRDKNDRWIRIEMTAGDLIVLPAGIYHRFTLDTKNYIKAMRLFVGEPVWTPINRPVEDNKARLNYVATLNSPAITA